MQCKQVVDGKRCPFPATLEVFWPGQTTQQCHGHEQKLQALALVMGFALESRPLKAESKARPMRVLYVLAHFPQGSESYVEAEMAYFLGQGVEIEIWSPTSGYGDALNVPVRRIPLQQAIDGFRPDVIHIHHMTTAAYYIDYLPKKKVTIRAHSFDWDETLAARLTAHPAVRKVFAFPHLARKVPGLIPLPVAYDPTLYYRCPKDLNSVVRLSAGLPTKRLEDFITVGNKLFAFANFTLALNLVIGKEAQVVDALSELNDSLGGYVRIRTNLSRAEASALVRNASIYMSTYDEKSHAFGMPISIAESMATGALVLARFTKEGVREYMGEAGVFYESIDEAEEIIGVSMNSSEEERMLVADLACRNAERFRSDVVLPRLMEEWRKT
jgi:hypothetical protein